LITKLQTFSAPYIAETQRLVRLSEEQETAAFVRTRNSGAEDGAVDIVFCGPAVIHEGRYFQDRPTEWIKQYHAMLERAMLVPLAGYFAYEFGYQFEESRWNELPIANGQVMFRFAELPYWYEADHKARVGRICIAPGTTHNGIQNSLLQKFCAFIECASPRLFQSGNDRSSSNNLAASKVAMQMSPGQGNGCWDRDEAGYIHTVEHILEDIRDGRYYEINFTQRYSATSSAAPPHVFSALVESLSPDYAAYFKFADEHVISASPELFLRKTGQTVQTCPIKGSFVGSVSGSEWEKLKAEHIMVVDLARNDLGRICNSGWVRVEEQCYVRKFGRLSHLESRIAGDTTHTAGEILRSTLPAASITGMPKVITVQAIANYERSPRGLYTGNCGILWPDGGFQLNVAIRTMRAETSADGCGWRYTLGAGGAIVADSDPEQEYRECVAKAEPLIRHLQ